MAGLFLDRPPIRCLISSSSWAEGERVRESPQGETSAPGRERSYSWRSFQDVEAEHGTSSLPLCFPSLASSTLEEAQQLVHVGKRLPGRSCGVGVGGGCPGGLDDLGTWTPAVTSGQSLTRPPSCPLLYFLG